MSRWGNESQAEERRALMSSAPAAKPRKQKRVRVITPSPFVARDRESNDQPTKPAKTLVRDAILDEPGITVAALQTLMMEQGVTVSIVTLSVMRGEFRSILKYLAQRDKLKNVDL
jgi:hypothetical protein